MKICLIPREESHLRRPILRRWVSVLVHHMGHFYHSIVRMVEVDWSASKALCKSLIAGQRSNHERRRPRIRTRAAQVPGANDGFQRKTGYRPK